VAANGVSRAWYLVVGAVLLVAGVVAAGWFATRDGGSDVPTGRFRATASLSPPRTQLFGDPVTAELEVELDARAVDADSVAVRPRFAPYTVLRKTEEETSAGAAVVRRYRFTLVCIRPTCAAAGGGGAVLPVAQLPARVTYRTAGGAERSVAVKWPTTEVASRLGSVRFTRNDVLGIDFSKIDVSPAWRGDMSPPPVSHRARPGVLAGALFAGAALFVLLGLVLLAPELRRLLRLAPAREPLASLPPLERALALLERALASTDAAERRKALDRLARELRRRGDDELASAARTLAWSPPAPPGEATGALAGEVERAIGGRR
jgi:hypothetical protein